MTFRHNFLIGMRIHTFVLRVRVLAQICIIKMVEKYITKRKIKEKYTYDKK